MSLYDYATSIKISAEGYPFYSLVMAAMRQADTDNLLLLKEAFPRVYAELVIRYNSPGGKMPEEINAENTTEG